MDALMLSRLQFAVTGMFHFIFVPLTLGLSVMVAWMETRYLISGDEVWLRMTKFWGKLFLINFALGIVTGITMEFQFGMNWAEYSRYVGDIFGAPLAIEATVAFFIESVFIGLWIFGWNKVSPKVHLLSIWLVAIFSNISGLVILLANGWMQNPVGYIIRNKRAEMVDFLAVLTNPYGLLKFGHQITSAYAVAAFFVLGISSWHLLRKQEINFFKRSFRQAAFFGLVATVLTAMIGDFSAVEVAKVQPAKLAAMESIWETQKGVGMNLLLLPDEKNERNAVERFYIPNMVSYLAFHDPNATITGLKDFPKDLRPPVLPVFLSFRAMVGIGTYLILASLAALFISFKKNIEDYRLLLTLLVFSIPLPYLGNQLGWLVAEVGRQPWIVYGVMKTADAVSKNVSTLQVAISLAGFTILYSVLGIIDIYLLIKYARKGPDHDLSGIINVAGRN